MATIGVIVVAGFSPMAHADTIALLPVSGPYPVGSPGWAGYDPSALPGNPPADVSDRAYSSISTYSDSAPAGGPAGTVTVDSGFSLGTVLNAVGITPDSFTAAEVVGPDSRPVLLTEAQAESPTAFPDGPAVIWQDSAGIHFLLPSDGSGSDGETFTDEGAGTGQKLEINLYSGALLSVDAEASTRKVAVDKPVRFNATVSGQLPGETLTYRWVFDDGYGGSQASISHSYAAPGTYYVFLRVSGSQDSIGYSAMLPVTVGKVPEGPNRDGGGKAKRRAAPTHGASRKGSAKGQPTRATKRPGSSDQSGPPSSPVLRQPGTSTGEPRPPHSSRSERSPRRQRKSIQVARPEGRLLSGIVIGSAGAVPRDTGSSTRSPAGALTPARTGHLKPHAGPVGEQAWIGLLALLAVASGAVLEGRWLRIPPRLRSGMTRA